MRDKLLHPATFLALAALAVALEVPSRAASLIDGKEIKKGTISGTQVKDGSLGRAELTPGVRALLTAPGPRGPQGPSGAQGVPGAPGPAVGCPATLPATVLHDGFVCIESGAGRAKATWLNAMADCRDEDRRLPTTAEEMTARQRPGAGIPQDAEQEWTIDYFNDGGDYAVTIVRNTGLLAWQLTSGTYHYRCVGPTTLA